MDNRDLTKPAQVASHDGRGSRRHAVAALGALAIGALGVAGAPDDAFAALEPAATAERKRHTSRHTSHHKKRRKRRRRQRRRRNRR